MRKKILNKKMFFCVGAAMVLLLVAVSFFLFWLSHRSKVVTKRTISECEALASKQQKDQAEQCFKDFLTDNPQNLVAKSDLANVNILQKKYSQSIQLYSEVSQANPDDTFALNNLANAYRDDGQNDQAEKYYKISIGKGNVDSVINLVTVYNTTGQFDKSVALLNSQIKINPKDKTLVGLLASTYSKSGDQKKAQSLLDSIK